MDLKDYVGKKVHIQFRSHEEWLVLFAPIGEESSEDEGNAQALAPEVMMMDGQGRKLPAAFPFINGKLLDEQGTLELETGNGGVIHVRLAPAVIHSVAVVVQAAEERRVETVSPGGIITP